MNLLIYDLTDFCKDMSVTDIVKYCGVNRYKQRNCKWDKEDVEKLNEWLEIKIKEMIKFKKRAERVLDDYTK